MKITRDGHMHSPYCPHGTKDSFDMYVQRAMELGLTEISFTEHMPYPRNCYDDQDFLDDCAPRDSVMNGYFDDLHKLQENYAGKIKINRGMEVDYLDGFEEETIEKLSKYGPELEDGLLSVHLINVGDKLCCVDDMEGFEESLNILGSVEKVYDRYYETLLKAVDADLGIYKPKRIGHPNLVRIYNKIYHCDYKNTGLLEELVKRMSTLGYEADMNTSGLRKPMCKEPYISGEIKRLIEKYKVPVVYGSDAHTASDVGRDFDKIDIKNEG